ncbi:MAG: aminotransferase class I/II-fold pyridoxal phosphate-dependent enzyme [Deltaproteobacteria bacterium]|nr:aminotransferase class I/II-fold pyridoxal phosphate-dependent enzyme [Deltaproteobacteria bacterium]
MSKDYYSRSERFIPRSGKSVEVVLTIDKKECVYAPLKDISNTGLSCLTWSLPESVYSGLVFSDIALRLDDKILSFGKGVTKRLQRMFFNDDTLRVHDIGIRFAILGNEILKKASEYLQPVGYVASELVSYEDDSIDLKDDKLSNISIADFRDLKSYDIFDKCKAFYEYVKKVQRKGLYQSMFRVTLTSPIDHRVTIFNPLKRCEQEILCFDSNSYFCLHRHPRVVRAAIQTIEKMGVGTPSAQLLSGTNRYLRELEEELCDFHKREDAIVFPSGFAANLGTITALVRSNDLIVRDRFVHASIHEGCRATKSKFIRVYPHNDMQALERIINSAEGHGCNGKMIISDGIFSMHGRLAPLPELVEIAKKYKAKLMIDDAHGLGVIGPTGGGIEEHFNMIGAADVLMGTLSKVLGGIGGYVCGSKDLIYYLRFFAASGFFTTALPAATCASLTEALKVIKEEPHHRHKLWHNLWRLWRGLYDAGLIVSEPDSAILTVFMGSMNLMFKFSRELFDLGIKCGSVAYPAVPKQESILRWTLCSTHTDEDIDRAIEACRIIGKRFGMLGKTPEEIQELGNSFEEA